MHVLCGTKSVNDIFTSICNCYWIGQVKRFLIKGLVRPKIYVSIFFSCASISFFIVVKLAPIRFCTVILELILLWYRFMYFLIFFWGGGILLFHLFCIKSSVTFSFLPFYIILQSNWLLAHALWKSFCQMNGLQCRIIPFKLGQREMNCNEILRLNWPNLENMSITTRFIRMCVKRTPGERAVLRLRQSLSCYLTCLIHDSVYCTTVK